MSQSFSKIWAAGWVSQEDRRQRTAEFCLQPVQTGTFCKTFHFQWTGIFCQSCFFSNISDYYQSNHHGIPRGSAAQLAALQERFTHLAWIGMAFFVWTCYAAGPLGTICASLGLLCHMLFFTRLCTKAITCACLLWGFMTHFAPLTTELCEEVHVFNSSPQIVRSSSKSWCSQNKKSRDCWKLSQGQQREKY